MSQRLVLVSDVSGTREDKWITTYLGALHPHFEITYYDLQELGRTRLPSTDLCQMRQDFMESSWAVAQKSFLEAEQARSKEETVYVGFGIGSKMIWETAPSQLAAKSLWLISSPDLPAADHVGVVPAYFYYGGEDPCDKASVDQDHLSIVPNFGPTMYMDQHIAMGICDDLIEEEKKSLQSA